MVSDKIKGLLKLKGKDYAGLAAHLGIQTQALHNKLHRDSYSAVDLIKIADFFGVDLAFIEKSNSPFTLSMDDIKVKPKK